LRRCMAMLYGVQTSSTNLKYRNAVSIEFVRIL
jgi:hypothetical protein